MKKSALLIKVFVYLLFVFSIKSGFAQNVGISSTSSFTPDASAALDISYTNKGLLIPRVALTATNAAGPITSPAISLLVYNTATAGTAPNNVTPGYYYWNGSAWVMLSTGTPTSNFWSAIGNSGTSYPTNFLGTTDNYGLHFKTNNIHRFWLDSLGSVAVGTSPIFTAGAAREKFLVDAGSVNYPTPVGAFNVISGKGYLDSYLQLNIQNTSPTASASSDIVASNDAATETTNYIDMGINSSAYSSTGVLGLPNQAYILATGNDFSIGNGTAGKSLTFFTGGQATTNEHMRIDGNGNVGIGNIAPTQKLDITGNLKLSGAFMPGNSAGTAGYFLVSSGAGAAPIWYNATAYINTAAWVLAGNPGTTPGTNFIGTTDAKDFVVKTNNAEVARFSSAGNLGIGTTAFNSTNPEKLLVDAGTGSYNVISGKGNLNNYLQLNIQNINAGTAASSDVVATADNGSETANYVDMGINSSANTSAFFGAANDAYLYNAGGTVGGNFFIGTSTSGKALGFLTGGGATTNERMRIDGSGNVGIGTTTPATKLHVFGANPLTLSGVVTGTNTTADSLLTITNGLVRKLPMATFASTGNDWSTIGNAGSTAGTNFIGTTDATDFVVRTNNIERARVTSAGNIGIGTTAPSSALHVVGTNPLTLNGVQTGTNTSTDSLLTLSSGVVRKLPLSNFAATANAWSTTGNGGTSAGTNYIGTTDATDFVVKTSNTEVARFNSAGNVGIGSSTFNSTNPEQLLVDAGTTSSYNVISGKGNLNNYLQLNIQNNSSGTGASSDIVASNNTATESVNFVDLGINSSGNTSTGVIGGANTAYLYSTGYDFAIGNGTSNRNLLFFTGGTGSNERMRITSTGSVGVGVTAPTAILHLKAGTATANTAPLKFTSGALMTTSAAGAVEFLTDKFYGTITTGAARKEFILNDGVSLTPGRVPLITTNGRLTDNANFVYDNVNSYLGVGVTAPISTLDLNGSVGHPISVLTTGAVTLGAANYTVIITPTSTATVTLPAAGATNTRRIYVIVNQTTSQTTVGSYVSYTGSTVTAMPGQTSITVQSDGTNWYQIQ